MKNSSNNPKLERQISESLNRDRQVVKPNPMIGEKLTAHVRASNTYQTGGILFLHAARKHRIPTWQAAAAILILLGFWLFRPAVELPAPEVVYITQVDTVYQPIPTPNVAEQLKPAEEEVIKLPELVTESVVSAPSAATDPSPPEITSLEATAVEVDLALESPDPDEYLVQSLGRSLKEDSVLTQFLVSSF